MAELLFDCRTATKTVAELLRLPKAEVPPRCTELSEGADAIVAADLRALELETLDAPGLLHISDQVDQQVCRPSDQDQQVSEPHPAVLVSETGAEICVTNGSRSTMITELYDTEIASQKTPRVSLPVSDETLKRVAAVIDESRSVSTLDLWPHLTAIESAELISACNFLMLKPCVPSTPHPSILDGGRRGAAAMSVPEFSQLVRHYLGLDYEVVENGSAIDHKECDPYDEFECGDEGFLCASCHEPTSYNEDDIVHCGDDGDGCYRWLCGYCVEQTAVRCSNDNCDYACCHVSCWDAAHNCSSGCKPVPRAVDFYDANKPKPADWNLQDQPGGNPTSRTVHAIRCEPPEGLHEESDWREGDWEECWDDIWYTLGQTGEQLDIVRLLGIALQRGQQSLCPGALVAPTLAKRVEIGLRPAIPAFVPATDEKGEEAGPREGTNTWPGFFCGYADLDLLMRRAGVIGCSDNVYKELADTMRGFMKSVLSTCGRMYYHKPSEGHARLFSAANISAALAAGCGGSKYGITAVFGHGIHGVGTGVWSSGIFKVLPQIHPRHSISPGALAVVNDYISYTLRALLQSASQAQPVGSGSASQAFTTIGGDVEATVALGSQSELAVCEQHFQVGNTGVHGREAAPQQVTAQEVSKPEGRNTDVPRSFDMTPRVLTTHALSTAVAANLPGDLCTHALAEGERYSKKYLSPLTGADSNETSHTQKNAADAQPTAEEKRDDIITINVKSLTGTTIALDVKGTDTIECVKEKLNQQTGTPQTDVLLIFAGKQLEADRTVADCNLQSDSTLHMVCTSKSLNLQFSVPLTAAVSVGLVGCVLTAEAAVFLAAVLEYLCAEVLELAGNQALDCKSSTITPRHVMLALRNDEDLNEMTKHCVIRESGAFPDFPLELQRGDQYNLWEDAWEKTFRDMQESAPHGCLVDPRDGRHYMLSKVIDEDDCELAVQRPVPLLDQAPLDVQRRAALEGLSEAQRAAFDATAADPCHTTAFRRRCVRFAQTETQPVIHVEAFRAVTEDLRSQLEGRILADSLAGPSQITVEALGLLQTATEGYLLHVLRGANRSAICRGSAVVDAKDIQLQSAMR